MAGQPFRMPIPMVVGAHLDGELPPWVASKDLILWLIRKYTVKGGLNRIFEFTGPGAANLSVTRRATVCNMITELGGTTAIFPSDEQTRRFLRRQRREEQWVELGADPDAAYDEEVRVDLGDLEPLIAKPSQPDNVVPVEQVAGTPVFQVCFGPSVNSWYEDLAISAAVLDGHHLPPTTAGTVSPGSRQISSPRSPARGSWSGWSGPVCGSWSRPVGRVLASVRRPRPARRACAPSTATSRAARARSTTRSTWPPRRPRQPPAGTAGSPIRARSATRPRSTIPSRWLTTS